MELISSQTHEIAIQRLVISSEESFDDMAYVDWNDDHNTPAPHIFCRYKRFRQHPYETIRVFKKIGDSEGLEEVRNFRARDLNAIL